MSSVPVKITRWDANEYRTTAPHRRTEFNKFVTRNPAAKIELGLSKEEVEACHEMASTSSKPIAISK